MKKQGFVLVESVTVLVVVLLSLTMLYTSYALVTRKAKEKENYDTATDKYIVYSLSQLGTSTDKNYKTLVNGKEFIKIDESNFSEYNTKGFIKDYEKLFEELNIEKIYVVESIAYYLYGEGNNRGDTAENFDNGTIEYMKTLQICEGQNISNNSAYLSSLRDEGKCPNDTDNQTNAIIYMIVVFNKNNDYYYASIQL